MRRMPTGRWAWEYLRRNPDYQNAHSMHVEGALTRQFDATGMEILQLARAEPAAEKWGLSFFASPNRTAIDAPVFWTESFNPNIVNVEVTRAEETGKKGCCNVLSELAKYGCKHTHFTSADGKEQLILSRQDCVVQLRCRGHSLLEQNVGLRFFLEGFGELDAKYQTVKRLNRFYERFLPEGASAHRWSLASRNLRDGLIALDVYQAGGTHRDAAKVIYGNELGDERFSDPSEATRNRMKRLRRRALQLMNGKYFDLMQKGDRTPHC